MLCACTDTGFKDVEETVRNLLDAGYTVVNEDFIVLVHDALDKNQWRVKRCGSCIGGISDAVLTVIENMGGDKPARIFNYGALRDAFKAHRKSCYTEHDLEKDLFNTQYDLGFEI